MSTINRDWWKDAVVYQIYPRSYVDSNGDGVGDLPGIIGKLDYLRDLGVNALWLSPICKSPNRDYGYDSTDHLSINPEFGTLDDYKRLTDGAHQRGMKIIFDMVCDYSSDQHPWFIEARTSRTNPKHDFYIWHEGKAGHEPNNWRCDFGDSAWTYNLATQEYYMGGFSTYQPDFNWQNPALRHQIYDIMREWIKRGVDGFRLDVINFLYKDPNLPDVPRPANAPANQKFFPAGQFYVDQPGVHPLLQEMRREVFGPAGVLALGECHGRSLTPEAEAGGRYIRADRGELDLMFHLDVPWFFSNKMVELGFKRMGEWLEAAKPGGRTTVTLNNHDTPRQVSAIGDDQRYRVESAKALGALLLTAPGTPFLYQGEEIGMTNVAFPQIEDYRDIHAHNTYQHEIADGKTPAEALATLHKKSRDNGRTPMQWDTSPHAGFTTGTPWLGVNPNYPSINVADALTDPDSILHWYRQLIAFRKQTPALVHGDYHHEALGSDGHAYRRSLDGVTITVIFNWSAIAIETVLPAAWVSCCEALAFSNVAQTSAMLPKLQLKPWEVRIYNGMCCETRHLPL